MDKSKTIKTKKESTWSMPALPKKRTAFASITQADAQAQHTQ